MERSALLPVLVVFAGFSSFIITQAVFAPAALRPRVVFKRVTYRVLFLCFSVDKKSLNMHQGREYSLVLLSRKTVFCSFHYLTAISNDG